MFPRLPKLGLGFALAAPGLAFAQPAAAPASMHSYGLVIHAGAAAILRKDLSPELQAEHQAKLSEALDAGYAVLDSGGEAIDAVVAAIRVLEDSPLYNAGKGAVLNAGGVCELDASIMDGKAQAAGAVAGLQHIKNPITLARDVMQKSAHVMLAGEGAEKFARELGYELVPNEYFQTPLRKKQLEKAKEIEAAGGGHTAIRDAEGRISFVTIDDHADPERHKWGTVGCAALDKRGNLAAGTSTGGMTNKKFGRVGDSPIIGAGTYANNRTCALSATGHGEYFIRAVVGHDVSARMEYQGMPLEKAAAATLTNVSALGGKGGVIAIDHDGKVTMQFNTPGMFRGFRLSTGEKKVAMFGDE
ncbi:beta-aspartyl-peptidase [Opitutaceae bacterium EW11]|nr:beta-aspartyl-peptidase [Opitutaceae bacterium EW11]